jgi:hypothetical protein
MANDNLGMISLVYVMRHVNKYRNDHHHHHLSLAGIRPLIISLIDLTHRCYFRHCLILEV